MPKREEMRSIIRQSGSYSLDLKGTPALLRKDVMFPDDLASGDRVKIFSTADGKYLISKSNDSESLTIGRITPAHIYFDDEISLKEK